MGVEGPTAWDLVIMVLGLLVWISPLFLSVGVWGLLILYWRRGARDG